MEELNGRYVNEESYKKGKKTLKIIGIICLIVAVVLIVIGIIVLTTAPKEQAPNPGINGDEWEWFENISNSMKTRFIGTSIILFGAVVGFVSIHMFVMAHKRDILAYKASSALPVAGEVVEMASEPVSKVSGKIVSSVASPIAKGVVDAKNSNNPTPNAQLRELKALYDEGVISKEEYEEKRKKFIDQL